MSHKHNFNTNKFLHYRAAENYIIYDISTVLCGTRIYTSTFEYIYYKGRPI